MERASTNTRRRAATLALVALLALAAPLPAARPARAAATFTVNRTADGGDLVLNGACDASLTPGLQCTLRAAIQEANHTAAHDTIAFNILGRGVLTIRPKASLPTITRRVTIDGYTQPGTKPNTAAVGTNAVLRIELDGADADGGGLTVRAGNSVIRGLAIGRFAGAGIDLIESGTTRVRIEGCFVGTDAAGTAARGNLIGVGVRYDADAATIGGGSLASRNLISGNANLGVFLDSGAAGSLVQGNLIGTDKTGAAPIANGGSGVVSAALDVVVGGDAAAEANTIRFNTGDGVTLDSSGATGNRILRNAISANGSLGIDLGDDGPTPNDRLDLDGGPNNRQNKPALTSAKTSRGATLVKGQLPSTPSRTFVLRFFANPAGGDEGERFIGQLYVTTNGFGNAAFTFTAPPIPAGQTVTATATSFGGDTSEFSAPRAVV